VISMRRTIQRLVILSVTFALSSFGYSFFAFVSREPVIHFQEYSQTSFLQEVGGHIAFGMIAAAPLFDAELILLTGILAIVIDVDHVLAALNLATNGRPSHSFLFIPLACLVAACVARRLGEPERRCAIVALLPSVAFFAHISYDIFAAYAVFGETGASFPLFAPFSFSLINFPFWAWIEFQAAAIFIATALRLLF